MPQHIEDLCEERARKGDGAFAVAYALLRLADAQDRTARQIEWLGTGSTVFPDGAIGSLVLQMARTGDQIAEALTRLADREE